MKRIAAFLLSLLMIIGCFTIVSSAAETTSLTIEFTGDEADRAGFAQSRLTVLPGDNAAKSGYYLFYYTDGTKVLSDYDEIGSVAITGTRAVFDVKDGAMIPEGASGIAVFESASRFLDNAPSLSAAVAKAEIPASKRLTLGTPETKFGAVSDVHMNYEGYSRGAYQKWANALEFFSLWGAEHIIVAGDMTGDRGEDPDLEAQYSKYVQIVNSSSFPFNKIYEGIGNHGNTPADAPLMDKYLGGSDEIHPYTNSPYYHVLIKGDAGERDNLYIFMAQEINAAGDSASYDNFSKAQIDWLEGLLTQYGSTDTNIFIIEHSPFLNYGAGDRKNGAYTTMVKFDEAFTQNMRLKTLLSTYKQAIVMSGHSHVSFYDDVNYSDEYNEFARTVHVGSTCQPCAYGGTSTFTRSTDGRYEVTTTYGSEAYTVEVYSDYIVYTGYNLSTGKKIPAACIIMPITPYGGAPRPQAPAVITPDKAFSGSGTKNDPYIIATADDFYNLTVGFNASTSSVESEMYGYGKYFLQTADIDMTGYAGYSGTEANGNAKSYFAGNYNGNGHTLTVNINDTNQRSVFPYIYGIIYNLKIDGSIISEVSAQPIRTSRGGIVNCIFDLDLYANYANGICYSNYTYVYNVYTSGTLSGASTSPAVYSDSSTDYVNMYHHYVTPSGEEISDAYGVRSNDVNAIAKAFNDRSSAQYNALKAKIGDITLDEVYSDNGVLSFKAPAEKPELSEGHSTFWLTHYNDISPEGAGSIFTSAYSGGAWWLHVAFSPVEGSNAYEITEISNGVMNGDGTALSIPEGGFVWAGNYGNDYPAIYEKDPVNNSWCAGMPNYVSAECNAMMQRALQWKLGDKFTFEGLDLSGKSVPTSTPEYVWYSPAYICTASYAPYAEPTTEYDYRDVNRDGKVNMFDYLITKSVYFGNSNVDGETKTRCDVNGDGKVNLFDYIAIKSECLTK